jgi:aminoglycoside phosphotransferase family enzyme
MWSPNHDMPELIEALSPPAAYPDPVDAVEVRQTHISVVFMAGRYAYTIKKPHDLGYVDFRHLGRSPPQL